MSEIGLLGKKIGMTREFYKTGQSIPVTVLKIEKGRVINVINEKERGYKAIQLGFGKVKNSKLTKAMKGFFTKKSTEPKKKLKEKRGYNAVKVGFFKLKTSKLSKQMKGYFAKKNTEPKKILKEFRVENNEQFKEGNELGLEIFKDKKFIDVRSKTIGKGFAGVMKRWNFGGLRASHGVSVSHRSHGSTGQRQDPGKVFKGKKMAGHMGDKIRTTQNIEIVKTDKQNNLIYLKGSIPGSKNNENR